MKILIAAKYASVYEGNFIPSVKSFAEYCKKNGDTVGFALPIEAEKREWCLNLKKKYPVYFIGNESNFAEAKKINQYIKCNGFNCLYTHFSLGLVFPLSICNRQLAIVRHTHTDMGGRTTLKTRLRMWIKRKLFYSKMAHIYVSERLQCMEGMQNKKNSFFLPNALVADRFELGKMPDYRHKLREKYNIPHNAIIVLMFGWHILVKGVDIALMSFAKTLKKEPNTFLFVVLGENDNEDFAKKYVDVATLSHVKFLKPVQNIEMYHAAADIFLSSSRSEGFSYSIMEALYLGESVVTSDLSAVQWALRYDTVLKFESENVDDCAEKLCTCIEKMSSNKKDRRKVSEQLLQDYSIEKWNDNVYEIIKRQYEKIGK